MSFVQLPPEDLVKKMVPTICRVVGVAFIVGGIVGLLLVPVCVFAKVGNIRQFAVKIIGGSILNLAVGFVVLKYMPVFMMLRFRKLRENSPF